MCKWGNTVPVWVETPAYLSHTGKDTKEYKDVDMCIAGVVRALNESGHRTIASCCGHGKAPGRISLQTEREILIMTYEQAQEVSRMFPAINKPEEIYLTEYTTLDESGVVHKYGGQIKAGCWDEAEKMAVKMTPPQNVVGILQEEQNGGGA